MTAVQQYLLAVDKDAAEAFSIAEQTARRKL